MPKTKSLYVCQACGAEHRQWWGRCPSCGNQSPLQEVLESSDRVGNVPKKATRRSSKTGKTQDAIAALTLNQISSDLTSRLGSGYGELDRVLGGGIVPGSLVLVGGDPGIGKSTLLLQVAGSLTHRLARVLYVSAEESGQQLKLRANRLGIFAETPDSCDRLYIMPETNLERILQELTSLGPDVAIVDSIQTLYLPELTSAPGSVVQVRECTAALMQLAKRENITIFIVGHVTKEGAIAGPRVLEHLVDAVLYFEGDRFASHRLLRSVKNRFGASQEIGIFDMTERGLQEVENPSALFLGNREEKVPGTSTVVACEGTRPLLVEIQALVSPTSYGTPRRSATGVDYNRLQQILAVLEKRVGVPLSKLDAYVASAGGLGVAEPAADLGIAIALVASFRDRLVDPWTIAIGEVGLGGQIRLVSQIDLRLREAAKLGFQRAIIPKGQSLSESANLEIVEAGRVLDGIVAALPTEED
ncbi:MAG: DNA repair protein RadA [Cyanobacteria bacterium P01_H01_bin.15]